MRLLFPRPWSFRYLVDFVNTNLGRNDWRSKLEVANYWQSSFEDAIDELIEKLKGSRCNLRVNGRRATLQAAAQLQRELGQRLDEIVRRVNTKATQDGRVAKVFPSGELEFGDAGEGLKFLADALNYEAGRGTYQNKGRRGRRWTVPALHLSLCSCGCGKFFLWEGKGAVKRKKFLDDKHRMSFHNTRNGPRKKQHARQRRSEGDPRYF